MRIDVTEDYSTWIDGLKDLAGRARIQARIARLADGNPGQHRVLSQGICELKIDAGPGYRVYYTMRGKVLVILLIGGDKSTQRTDIRRAKELAAGLP